MNKNTSEEGAALSDNLKNPEQTRMDLPSLKPEEEYPEFNVFRQSRKPDKQQELLLRHRQWLNSLQKEYPWPGTPYRIGVYIRYFNQTKYENYLDYHKQDFRDTIALCPLWTLVDFYVDNGSVAPKMGNAPEWVRLLDDCFSGKVNLIVTQKLKNVSRDPEDIALIARLLAAQEKPCGIYFISEDIFTLSSYYLEDLCETEFLPEGWQILPDDEEETLRLTEGNHVG